MKYLIIYLIIVSSFIAGQNIFGPSGGEIKYTAPVEHLPEEMISREIKYCLVKSSELLESGKFGNGFRKVKSGTYIWPVKAAANLNDFSFWGISGFVDQDPGSGTLDYNGGSRTYNGHKGTDIFTWPFPWYKVDNEQVEVIACADGIINGKRDGNYDRNCAMGSGSWNAVYVTNFDGNIIWYGHMKNGSLTDKEVGDTVYAGEYLGVIASSGSSTGPHLHLQIFNSNGNLLDPWAGPSNPTITESLWAEQLPYYNSAVIKVATHFRPPVLPPCPETETLNESSEFSQEDTVYFVTYYRDQMKDQVSNFTIINPENEVFYQWSHKINDEHYSVSYWYWYWPFPEDAAVGDWKFQVQFENVFYTHTFKIKSNVVSAENKNQELANFRLEQNYPNPFNPQTTINYELKDKGYVIIKIFDLLGREIKLIEPGVKSKGKHSIVLDMSDFSSGTYIYQIKTGSALLSKKMTLIK